MKFGPPPPPQNVTFYKNTGGGGCDKNSKSIRRINMVTPSCGRMVDF